MSSRAPALVATRDRVALATALLALAGSGCAPPRPAPPPPLPELPAATPAPVPGTGTPAYPVAEWQDPLAGLPAGKTVSLSTSGAEIRALLPALAEAAGVSLVLGPEVQGQISVNLMDVPARDALRSVLAVAGLGVAPGPPRMPFGPTVFYTLPVNVDAAGVEMIMQRFGVGREVAEMIVRNRVP